MSLRARALPPGRFAMTRPLVEWLAEDPAWPTLPWRTRAFLRWNGAMGSLNARLGGLDGASTAPHAAADTPRLLVVGLWRSGTTALHERLAASGDWITPRTWQCMSAPTVRLLRPRGTATRTRPMDDMPVTGESPQEDEFALLSLGAPSAYRGFLAPHRLDELHPTLRPDWWLAQDAWFADWERFLGAVVETTPGPPGRPLLLKSPNHAFRLPAIRARRPGTRFVWIVREPAEILASNLRLWTTMADRYGLTPLDPAALQRFLLAALAAAARILESCLREMAPSELAVVAQSDLQRDPAGLVDAIGRWFEEDPARGPSAGETPAPAHAIDAVEDEAPVECAAVLARLARAQHRAQARFGLLPTASASSPRLP